MFSVGLTLIGIFMSRRLSRMTSRCRRIATLLSAIPFWYNGRMDLNIKELDDNVYGRLRDQAAAAGLSMQQYLRTELTRIASRLSPSEFARRHNPMTREEFLSVRRRLREMDAS